MSKLLGTRLLSYIAKEYWDMDTDRRLDDHWFVDEIRFMDDDEFMEAIKDD